ncbi:MAG: LCP family protein [Nakamurella sp.]
MTDHEDGPPPRGPRRYGPSATGAPRQDGVPPYEPPRAWSAADRTPSGRPVPSDPRPYPPLVDARSYKPGPGPTRPGSRPSSADPGAARPRGSLRGDPPPTAYRRPAPATPPVRTPSRHRWAGRLRLGRLVAGVLSAITLLATGFVTFISDTAGQQAAGIISDCSGLTCTGTTILLVGSDARVDAAGNPLTEAELRAVATEADGGGTSTDTMMLIHIPAGGGRATAVSIPRDSWVVDPPPGPSDTSAALVPYNANKINSFYGSAKAYTADRLVAAGGKDAAAVERESSDAGRKMLISVLEGVTGTHIDHYAEINLFGFYLLSDAIGGVPVCLLNPVNDPFSGADFAAGEQEVQGTAALSFVRQRHGLPNGDLDRVKRQQAFLSGAIRKVLSVGTLTNPARLSALVDAADRSIVLSDGFNLLDLAGQMSSMSSGNINFQTIPTHGPESSTQKDALSIDVSEIRSIFAALDTDPVPTDPATNTPANAAVQRSAITVDVQNATVTGGLAQATSDTLTGVGWGAGAVSQYPGTTAADQLAQTSIRYATGDEAAAAQLQADLGIGVLEPDDKLPAGQLLVVVGRDRVDGAAPSTPAPVLAQTPAETINAAAPGCVN